MASTTTTDSATSLPATTRDRLLKVDTMGRVRTSRERRQAILEEFDQSGVSAAQFAQLAGIRYSTFAAWMARRRRTKLGGGKTTTTSRRPPLRLVEAVIDRASSQARSPDQALLLHLPGGAKLEISSPTQVSLVVALVQALQPPAVRC